MALLTGKSVSGEQMALTLAVWVCTLPAVFLIVAPFWGFETAGILSLIVLAILGVMCAGLCTWKIGVNMETLRKKEEDNP